MASFQQNYLYLFEGLLARVKSKTSPLPACLLPLEFRFTDVPLSIFYRYFVAVCSSEPVKQIPLLLLWLSVYTELFLFTSFSTVFFFMQELPVSSFFYLFTAKLWNCSPSPAFPPSCDFNTLKGSKKKKKSNGSWNCYYICISVLCGSGVVANLFSLSALPLSCVLYSK